MNKYKYFIKTEDEFIKEFGDNWRSRVDFGFPSSMNYLFGYEIDIKEHDTFVVNGRLILNDDDRYVNVRDVRVNHNNVWSINNKMVKEIFISPTYNQKRKLVYE